MKRLRSVVFWTHLAAGSTAGVIIFVMSITGALLAVKPQILNTVDAKVRVVRRRLFNWRHVAGRSNAAAA